MWWQAQESSDGTVVLLWSHLYSWEMTQIVGEYAAQFPVLLSTVLSV